jgi:hypothetical protein
VAKRAHDLRASLGTNAIRSLVPFYIRENQLLDGTFPRPAHTNRAAAACAEALRRAGQPVGETGYTELIVATSKTDLAATSKLLQNAIEVLAGRCPESLTGAGEDIVFRGTDRAHCAQPAGERQGGACTGRKCVYPHVLSLFANYCKLYSFLMFIYLFI